VWYLVLKFSGVARSLSWAVHFRHIQCPENPSSLCRCCFIVVNSKRIYTRRHIQCPENPSSRCRCCFIVVNSKRIYTRRVTQLSTNPAQCRVTLLMCPTTLPLYGSDASHVVMIFILLLFYNFTIIYTLCVKLYFGLSFFCL